MNTTTSLLVLTVRGSPAPQGSKKFVGMTKDGRGLMVESSKRVKPWRSDVRDAGVLAMAGRDPFDGPLVVVMTFTLPKPSSAPKGRTTWPCRKPDASKLARSTEDALTDAGVWVDDARVVSLTSNKVYPGEGVDSLGSPGVVIRISHASAQRVHGEAEQRVLLGIETVTL